MKTVIILSQIAIILFIGYFIFPRQEKGLLFYFVLYLIVGFNLIFSIYFTEMQKEGKKVNIMLFLIIFIQIIIFVDLIMGEFKYNLPIMVNYFIDSLVSIFIASFLIAIPLGIGAGLACNKKEEIEKRKKEIYEEAYAKALSEKKQKI